MLNALKPRNREYKTAIYVAKGTTKRVTFKYEILSAVAQTYAQPLTNIISEAVSMAIRTNFNLPFHIQDKVIIGEREFVIADAQIIYASVNGQSLGLTIDNVNTYWQLSLA